MIKLNGADSETKSITGPSDHEVDMLTLLFEDGKLVKETTLDDAVGDDLDVYVYYLE